MEMWCRKENDRLIQSVTSCLDLSDSLNHFDVMMNDYLGHLMDHTFEQPIKIWYDIYYT